MSEINVVDFIYNSEECHSDNVKILKIIKWLSYMLIAEVKVFIKVCVYYWI